MKKRHLWVQIGTTALFVLTFISLATAQQPVIQPIGNNGEINWMELTIRATGSGAPNPDAPNIAAARIGAERAAKADALRNLLETVKGVRIDSQTLVVNAMTQNDTIRTQVQGIVKGARVVNTKFLSDGGVEVTIEVGMAGPLTQTLIPPQSFGTQNVPKTGDAVYTGLIIDSRGLELRTAMAPKVLAESAFVSQEWATKFGVMGYAKDLDGAKKNDRVTANPLVVKAVKVTGVGSSDLMIRNADAQGLRDMTKNLSFLEQCRVLAVVD
ncbi:MAG: LPP20 family lipoprotein [Deltaproteobacteria bacterium]|nr:LPP20 family lipoprotein [Deltaproteobacteria bacterium]